MNKKQLIVTWAIGIVLFLVGLGYFILSYFYSQLNDADLIKQRFIYIVIFFMYLIVMLKMGMFRASMGFFKLVMLKLFPSFGYKGVVNTLINIYNKLKGEMSEQEILNHLVVTRIALSFKEEAEAEKTYGYLINDNSKTLKDVIKAIINYEYFESVESKAIISKIPREIVEEQKKKYMDYIEERLKK
ncbi:MAG: hypothetical protein P9M01_01140 [Candidatus Kappaea frigidicola]|nr:hypothetical protein [Candidatus Kappaea frigidicola]